MIDVKKVIRHIINIQLCLTLFGDLSAVALLRIVPTSATEN